MTSLLTMTLADVNLCSITRRIPHRGLYVVYNSYNPVVFITRHIPHHQLITICLHFAIYSVYYTRFPITCLLTMTIADVNIGSITRRIPSPLRGLCLYVVYYSYNPVVLITRHIPHHQFITVGLQFAIYSVSYTIFPIVNDKREKWPPYPLPYSITSYSIDKLATKFLSH
uniref:Uncharacterized protein n=1 Tax=Rhodotorula toruloides (strain NP11) TaxID=1130832 RepID=A0A7G8ZGF3_RHOT1|nr:hypothetical protein JR093_mgp17 [Rhodotorula toruloides]YP_009988038.1 hypothetical protein JR093_mgp07 [Rhodotorula toruloides]QNL17838.1 hypothetical protein [Rhodotorula toruloides]QNL17848.1 hypothetical protein [Rhodotorula toruloides]CAE5968181.1 hypothetical protein [Rhodotorula toruloides]CAE5968207.1 hypothetical protein [Rhodotorula toruloides]